MTNENILDAIGGINEKAVQDAKAYKRSASAESTISSATITSKKTSARSCSAKSS